ncbi:CHASE3 domain-containing protein, partial [Eisenbergiella porci]
MYAKILHRIKNMGFRKKITGISLAISLIPVILLGIFSYGQMRSLMLERESLALRETLRQETDHLNYKLESYLSALNLICWNEGIRTSLSKDYETNVDMYLAYRDVIDPMFLTVRSLNRDITSISVYTDNHMNPHGNVLRPLEEAAGEAWFDQACRSTAPFFQISEDGRSILLLCQFYYKYVPYT